MSRPKVLVLLAAYNGSRWITEQILSILEQVDVNVRLVISDDHSTDDTLSTLGQFAALPNVQIISPPIRCGSAAGNFLFLLQQRPSQEEKYVAFADQDDIWFPAKLARACARIENAGGYSCSSIAFWEDGKSVLLKQRPRPTRSDFLFEGAGQGCTFVLTKEFYERVRRYLSVQDRKLSQLHYHDWAVYALARVWGYEWTFDPVPMLRYRQHHGNDTGARASVFGVFRRLRLIRDGWYRKQLQVIAGLISEADNTNPMIKEWHALINSEDHGGKRMRIVLFCLQGGRRRLSDRMVSILAASMGWI